MRKLAILALLQAATLTATTNGAALDVSGYTGLGQIALNSSPTNTAGNTAAVKLQDSPDGATWTDTGDVFATVDHTAGSDEALYVNFDKYQQYVRAVSTLAGTSPQVTQAVTVVGELANS